jgi:hypothetical protein
MMYLVTDFLTGMWSQSAPAWRVILAWSQGSRLVAGHRRPGVSHP